MLSSPVKDEEAGGGAAFFVLAIAARLGVEAERAVCIGFASVWGGRCTQKDSDDAGNIEDVGFAVCARTGWAQIHTKTVNPATVRIFHKRGKLNILAPLANLPDAA
jgi:hypothetical protein